LVVSGRIVRARGKQVAVRMVQHEFRTLGVPAEHRSNVTSTLRTPLAFLSPEPEVAALS